MDPERVNSILFMYSDMHVVWTNHVFATVNYLKHICYSHGATSCYLSDNTYANTHFSAISWYWSIYWPACFNYDVSSSSHVWKSWMHKSKCSRSKSYYSRHINMITKIQQQCRSLTIHINTQTAAHTYCLLSVFHLVAVAEWVSFIIQLSGYNAMHLLCQNMHRLGITTTLLLGVNIGRGALLTFPRCSKNADTLDSLLCLS